MAAEKKVGTIRIAPAAEAEASTHCHVLAYDSYVERNPSPGRVFILIGAVQKGGAQYIEPLQKAYGMRIRVFSLPGLFTNISLQ